ncbi:MAG: bifunctional glycosyltransferase family 2/GtrA family protein [Butyricicoccus sp.]|nr:bifunctional glycosyltransferase family 2/GtrA family protein [Butyricicoccus sp.]
MENAQKKVTVVLPSLDPDEKFSAVVDGLLSAGFSDILIVNDGSSPEHLCFFERAAKISPAVTVLTHEQNRGKGRALKTAFEYILQNRPDSLGAVTIDGDGQHLTEDILACSEAMLEQKNRVILGCRNFDEPHVPPKSRSGNKFTRTLLFLGCGIRLSDTQTGLRAIPREFLPPFCEMRGERFEYETNMLLEMKRQGIAFSEVQIQTVYEGKNEGTHFRPVVDSLRIMRLIIVFMASSLSSCLIDLAIFYIALRLLPDGKFAILAATAIARALSSFYNFNMNKKLVFGSGASYRRALFRYYCLCLPQMLISALLVTLLGRLASAGAILATVLKFCVDTALFCLSFFIQREWVFREK